MKKILFLTTFVVFIFIPISINADIIINEIAWMGTVDGGDYEWIELYNNEEKIDLSGWKIENAGAGNKTLEISIGEIFSKEFFLICKKEIGNCGLITGALSLHNEYEKNGKLVLRDNLNKLTDQTPEPESKKWPAGDNSTKQTMQLIDSEWETGNPTPGIDNVTEEPEEPEEESVEESEAPTIPSGDNNPPIANAGDNIIGFIGQEIEFDGTNSSDPDENELFYSWNMGDGKVIDKPSFTYKYSYPGTYLVTLTVSDGQDYTLDTITIKVKPQQITINEFIPDPEGKDEENEWIEIYNDSDSIVNISEWQLDDIASGSKPFIFPENTLIAPKSYIVFSRQISGIALNNDKDSVRLLLPEGVVFQEINYENPKQGQSSAHTDEGFVWSVPTPGMANIVSPPINMGLGGEEEFVYQQPIEPETTKESSQDYSWYFQSDFDKEIEGGYVFLPIKEQPKADDQFAAISNLAPQAKFNENQKAKQDILNLVLMIIAVILAGLIIGLSLTKLSKKVP